MMRDRMRLEVRGQGEPAAPCLTNELDEAVLVGVDQRKHRGSVGNQLTNDSRADRACGSDDQDARARETPFDLFAVFAAIRVKQ